MFAARGGSEGWGKAVDITKIKRMSEEGRNKQTDLKNGQRSDRGQENENGDR